MTINAFNPNSSTVVAGLGTQTCNVVTAGLYTCAVNFTIPYVPAGSSANSASTAGQSGLQIVVNQNGTPVLTLGGSSSNPTPTQPSLGGSVRIACAANDVITVVLSSANAVDAALNAVKGTINFYFGE